MSKAFTWKVDLTKQAQKDIKAIVRFITNREGADMGQNILNEFQIAKESLRTLPDRGRIPPELERLNVLDFREHLITPYRMIYQISKVDSTVYVHLVVDGRRDLPEILETRLLRLNRDSED